MMLRRMKWMKAVWAGFVTAFILLPSAAHAGTLTKDTVWSGTVRVEGQLIVPKGVTLTVMPRARVLFLPGKLDEEGLAQSGILVKGAIVARGGKGARIAFTSGAAKPSPGDWGEIKLVESSGSEFTNCDFSCGGWGVHVHDSRLSISKCTFINNSYGGIRGVGGDVEVTGCTLRGMDIGIRYWKGAPSIHHNTITGNRTGIFCRQDTGSASIYFNNIYGNTEYDMKLGDAHKEDVDARRNWWGTKEVPYIKKKIYDKDRDGYIGRVIIEPVLDRRVELP